MSISALSAERLARSICLCLSRCVELRTTDAEVEKEIDRLIDTYTDGEIADVLNERGVRTLVTTPLTAARVGRLPCDLSSHRSE